jgi:hypothetical protein
MLQTFYNYCAGAVATASWQFLGNYSRRIVRHRIIPQSVSRETAKGLADANPFVD